MLVIRNEQMACLADERRRRFIATMVGHLRHHFHGELWAVGNDELTARVTETCDRAATYGIKSERDLCRFLNLAAKYGWHFDRARKTAWTRDILTDAGITSPGLRLDCLIDECLHRSEAAEKNARLRRQFQVDDHDGVAGAADPYAAMQILLHKP